MCIKKTIQKYLDSLSKEQIQDKLDAMMHMLFKIHAKGDGGFQTLGKEALVNPMLIKSYKKNKEVIESLRRKRLNVWIEKIDIDETFIFYGKVKLKSIKRKKRFYQ